MSVMDALVMCGGTGTRFDADYEKPLFPVGGEPMVDRVLAALAPAPIEDVYAVVSPHVPETTAHVDAPVIETPGEGYATDLAHALADERVAEPVLTVAADLPLLEPAVIEDALDAHASGSGSVTLAVPTFLQSALDVSVDATFVHEGEELTPAGVAVVDGDPDRTVVRDDARLAVDVDRPADARVAERLLVSQ